MTEIVDEALRRSIDETLAERLAEQEAYVAYGKTDFVVASAGLLYIRDQYHRQYLDFTSGGGLLPLGHSPEEVGVRVAEQNAHHGGIGFPGEYVLRWPVEYAKRLVQSLPNASSTPLKVYFTPDEDSAFSLAMTIAQRVTNRVFLQGTIGGDRDVNWEDQAALVLHFVSKAGKPLDPDTLAVAVSQAHQGGALIIADESRTGFGRTGMLWGQERWQVVADITVVGGAGGGGYPFGAVVAPASYFDVVADEVSRRPQAGHPAICAAGYATIEAITGPLLEHVTDAGHVLDDGLAELQAQFPELIEDHSGVGLMHYLRFRKTADATQFVAACREKGLLVHPERSRTVELTPPLIASELEVRRGVDLMGSACLDWIS